MKKLYRTALSQLLAEHDVKAIFCKLLTKNEDSGRHGIVVPVDAYRIMPSFKNKGSGSQFELTCLYTFWTNNKGQQTQIRLRYKHFHQPTHSHAERRLTNFRSKALDNSVPNDLFVLGRTTKGYVAHFVPPNNQIYNILIRELGLEALTPGSFVVDAEWDPTDSFEIFSELRDLLRKYDQFEPCFYPTINPAPEGVGATYEKLLGIRRNNSPMADFKGIEIKCYKLREGLQPYDQDLFLKEPTWMSSGAKAHGRRIIEKFGYEDELGRRGLKVRVRAKPNAQGLYLWVDKTAKTINIMHANDRIGFWRYETIEKRLLDKHRFVAFIGAERRETGAFEEFHYKSLIFCSDPSLDAFAKLVKNNFIWIELRMHLNGRNQVRNHGTQFRINDSKLPDLFAVNQKLR